MWIGRISASSLLLLTFSGVLAVAGPAEPNKHKHDPDATNKHDQLQQQQHDSNITELINNNNNNDNNNEDIGDKCHGMIYDKFVDSGFGDVGLVPEYKVHDDRMEVCYDGRAEPKRVTCCTHRMERKSASWSVGDLRTAIRKRNSELRNLISRNIATYRDELLTMIKNSERKTDQLYGSVYHIGTTEKTAELTRLFNDLSTLYDQPDGSVLVYESVSRFFNHLFPFVFHNILNDPSVVDLTDEYRKCLLRTWKQIGPHIFGDIPRIVSRELSQALSVANLFLTSMQQALEAINLTDDIALDKHCSKALVKMQFCSHCENKPEVKPCRNLCLNVMRGCLVQLQSLDQVWNRFLDAVAVFDGHKGPVSIEKHHKAFDRIHTRISEGIMHAMENTHKFYKKVTTKCGKPQTSGSKSSIVGGGGAVPGAVLGAVPGAQEAQARAQARSQARAQSTGTLPGGASDPHERGRLLRQFLFTSMRASKGIYGQLADRLCDQDHWAAQNAQENCWNARLVSAYDEPVTGKSLSAQLQYNPEMVLTGHKQPDMDNLVERIDTLSERIVSQVGDQAGQADSGPDGWKRKQNNNNKDHYVTYGSGYGYQNWDKQRGNTRYNPGRGGSGDGADGDDEDSLAGSGSGYSGDGRQTNSNDDDIYIENQSPHIVRNNNNKPHHSEPVPGSTYKKTGAGAGAPAGVTSRALISAMLAAILLWING